MEIQRYTYNLNEPRRGQASEDSKLQRGQCCMVTFCEVSNNQVHGVKGKDDGWKGLSRREMGTFQPTVIKFQSSNRPDSSCPGSQLWSATTYMTQVSSCLCLPGPKLQHTLDLNSGSHASVGRALPTEPSLYNENISSIFKKPSNYNLYSTLW